MDPIKSRADSAVKRLDEIREDANIIRITVNPVNRDTSTKDMSNESFKVYSDGIDYIVKKELVDVEGKFCGELYIKPSNVLFTYQASYSDSKK